MSVVTTLAVTVAVAIVKQMVSSWLGDEMKSQISQDLLDLGQDRLLDRFVKKVQADPVEQLARQVVTGMAPLWEQESRDLGENARAAVVFALAETIARVEAGDLIQQRLNGKQLANALQNQHAAWTVGLSGAETAIYARLLQEICGQIVYMTNHFAGYATLLDRHLLESQDELLDNTRQLLAGPAEDAREYERAYRQALPNALNRFDPIGIGYAEENVRRQRLDMAYMGLRLEMDETSARAETLGVEERSLLKAERPLLPRGGVLPEILPNSSRMVIRGQPGSGKSTLLRWLAARTSREELGQEWSALSSWDGMVPFYLRLRSIKQGKVPNAQEWPKWNVPALALEPPSDWMHQLLTRGRALILIDGVDEVAAKDRKSLLESLEALVAAYPLARYVITSRPAAIKNWPEWSEWTRTAGFETASLQEMELEQVFAFVDR
jgi:hypothetical protein